MGYGKASTRRLSSSMSPSIHYEQTSWTPQQLDTSHGSYISSPGLSQQPESARHRANGHEELAKSHPRANRLQESPDDPCHGSWRRLFAGLSLGRILLSV